MPRFVVVAQNVGAFPARFLLWGYREQNGILHPEPVWKVPSKIEVQPGDFYRYEANVETTIPLHELHWRSPITDGKDDATVAGVGKFHIDTLKWGEHFMKRAIIMHNPIGMIRPR